MERRNKNNKNPLENEWVIKLIDAAENVVNGYEDYIMNNLGYRELAIMMKKLRELLPDGCKDNDDKENNS